MTKRPSKSEWLVLQCLWKQSPLEIKDLQSMLFERTGWNANTIRSMVVRLQEKGMIGAIRDTHKYRYYPIADKTEYLVKEMQDFVDVYFDGAVVEMITFSLSTGPLDKSDYSKIRYVLSKKDDSSTIV